MNISKNTSPQALKGLFCGGGFGTGSQMTTDKGRTTKERTFTL